MKHDLSKKRTRTNAILGAVGAFAVGIGLLFLSRVVHVSAQKAAAEPAVAASAPETAPASAPETAPAAAPAAAPASAPASAPAATPNVPSDRKPVNRQAAGERVAGLLLLFGLMAIGLAIVCVGWIIYDIRRSRPAWMSQTKYPVMEKKKHRNRQE